MIKFFSSHKISSFLLKLPHFSLSSLNPLCQYNSKILIKSLYSIKKQKFSANATAEELEIHYKKFLETEVNSKIISNPILNKTTSSHRKVLKDIFLNSDELTLTRLSKKLNIPIETLEMSYIYIKDPKSKTTIGSDKITLEEAKILGYEFNFKVLSKESRPAANKKFPMRPPVVTIMGHVDHGKTTLLDALRDSSIAQNEYGGITQKIGAFHAFTKEGKQITFIDTPGHEAFINMRIRGASSTDLIILVVSAVDGVQQQTIEVIKIAQKTEVPLIVAINKIDLKGANPEEIESQLYEIAGLGIDVKGGNIPVIHISAKEKMNLDLLEELILYEAEQLELRQDPNQLAEGVVIEARKLDDEDTTSCTVLIQKGTLKNNDFAIIGSELFRVRHMKDDRGKLLSKAGPSYAIEIIGLKELPSSGDPVFAVENEIQGKLVASRRKFQEENSKPIDDIMSGEKSLKIKFANRKERQKFYSGNREYVKEKYDEAEDTLNEQLKELKSQQSDLSVVGFENITEEMNKIQEKLDNNKKYMDEMLIQKDSKKTLKILLKGPDQGTLETLRVQIYKLSKLYPEIKLQMMSTSVGGVSEADIKCCAHFKCMLFTMDVPFPNELMIAARRDKIVVKSSRLIFGVTDELKKMLEAESKSNENVNQAMKGTAEIGNVFEIKVSRNEKRKVAGCTVSQGRMHKNHRYKVIREDKAIGNDLTLVNLKKFKSEVMEIAQGEECGLCFEDFDDLQPGDVIQAFDYKDQKKKKNL